MSYYPNQQPGYNQQVPYQQNYGQVPPPPPQQGQHPPYPQPPPQGYPPDQGAYHQKYHPYQTYQAASAPHPQEQQRFVQSVYPPSGQYQQPPPTGFAPPPHNEYHAPHPNSALPPQQYAAFIPQSMPSPGYDPNQHIQGNMLDEALALRKAMKGIGTDEKVLINILSKPDPLQMKLLVHTFNDHHKRDLGKDVRSETSGNFRETLMALISGPLEHDVMMIREAVRGLGTRETFLNDTLVGRSNADIRAIKHAYQLEFARSMEADVADDLSFKTKDLFKMIMSANRAEETAPVIPQNVQHDVMELDRAMKGIGAKQETVCSILTYRSDGQIRAVAEQYRQAHNRSLADAIKNNFDGHMQEALLLMLSRACDRAMSDADDLEDSMVSVGTKKRPLLNRVVRVHWNRAHLDQVKRAYLHKYHKDLIKRIEGEVLITGDFRKILVACLD